MAQTAPQVTWTRIAKFGGEWGLRGPAALLVKGATVRVFRQSGSSAQVIVGDVVTKFDGVAIARVVRETDGKAVEIKAAPAPKAKREPRAKRAPATPEATAAASAVTAIFGGAGGAQ